MERRGVRGEERRGEERRGKEGEVDKEAKRAVALESSFNPVHTGFAVFLPH